MNKILIKRSFTVIIAVFCLLNLKSQDKLSEQIPVDSKVRVGKLDNGFKYYIRQNSKPEKRVEMRLVVNAGSVLEDDDQRGLAHFIEHMAFNGTKNFAKNDLVHYMQSVGVQFGPEVNASTGFGETIYMLTLPTDSAHIIEKGFQIMEDWAHNISFDESEIDKERGIIIEEWRMNQGFAERFREKLFPVLFEGSKYSTRNPIGKKEIIENASYETIKRFYSDWYRPDLMAFVIVGDINPDEVEKTICEHFEGLKNPQNEKPRGSFPIPDQKSIKTMVFSDKEIPVVQVALICKADPDKTILLKDYKTLLMRSLISGMLTQRYNELREQANPPLLMGQAMYEDIFPEKSIFELTVVVPETGIDRGIQTLIQESERAAKFGFTEGEVKRQKKEISTAYENAYNERDKTNSAAYAQEYIRNFLKQECIPGIEFEYNFVKNYLDSISVEDINEVLRKSISKNNCLLVVIMPQKEGLALPGDNEVMNSVNTALNSDIKPYEDKVSGLVLMDEKPTKGRILLSRKNANLDITEMKLSNGARVILKPTDFKDDQILFGAYSPGGYSVYGLSDHMSASYADYIISQCGVSKFSLNELTKLLAGKNVSLSPYVGEYFEGVSGSASPKDVESMFQLNYLYFTQPRVDSAMFVSLLSLQKDYYKNALSDPETYFQDQFTRAITQNHPRANKIPTEEEISKVNRNRVLEIYKDRFSDASDFTFFIIGSFKMDSIKPLIEDYIASLPSLRRQESWKDMGIRPPAKKVDLSVYKGNDPKSRVALYFESDITWDPKVDFEFECLGQLLSIRYIDVIREELSGAYTVRASGDMAKIPYSRYMLNILIPCSPQNTNTLTEAAFNEIKLIRENGVKKEDLVKVTESQRRDLEKNMKENSFWLNELMNGYRNDNPELINQYAGWINSLSSEELQNVAKNLTMNQYVRVVLYPEKQ